MRGIQNDITSTKGEIEKKMNFELTRLEQMDWSSYENFRNYYAEPKLDGMRVIIEKKNDSVRILRENGIDRTNQFPEVVERLKNQNRDFVLDGEMCILKSDHVADFSSIQSRLTNNSLRIKVLSRETPATFVAFDILKFEGEDVTGVELAGRKVILAKVLQSENVKIVKTYSPQNLFQSNNQQMEGIVLKDPTKPYYNSQWIKFKNWVEKDFKVVGHTSDKRLISALLLSDFNGNSVGKVNYTGYPQTEEMLNKLKGMTAVIKFLPTFDQKLRFPILKELREK